MVKESKEFNFEQDEKVLCYHGPFIYEAKAIDLLSLFNIIKREKKEEDDQEVNMYFVHYKGWKQTWDEWITEDRVLKYTESNRQKQKQLQEMNARLKTSRAPTRESTEPRGRKRYRDSDVERQRAEEETRRIEFKLIMPETLKGILVDDWENITKNRLVLNIPGEYTVDKILDEYKNQYPVKDDVLDEFIKGIRLYFNKTLGSLLLYRNEHDQYTELCANKEPSSIYGAEHLLRLFVEMPNLLAQASIDAETQNELKSRFEDFLNYMQEREKDYFLNDYQTKA
ncbi:MRG-domain-containing protein [Rhizopus microsporus ATCC 52813]|uniref:Chromatin modification-related protein EAF3 n=1 Tax=Rhizopus microsporus ATCC 52813 TaxID=1340429 RepID=A0A2G4SVD1_RHIZD|nr:MRG-domain-containing protein [Rhizopus microsporus ATCC 52813]PHZ12730.1 MRG-domain-containing protein [Rhizopus microsporus ATCC 52813]